MGEGSTNPAMLFCLQQNFHSVGFVGLTPCSICGPPNTRMIAYLKLSGWELVKRTMSPPSSTGEMVELFLFGLTRENYIRREGQSWVSPRSPEPVNIERSGSITRL